MFMKVIKNKNYAYISFATSLVAGTLLYIFPPVFPGANAAEYTGEGTAEGTTQFSVNVQEVLSMDITTPTMPSGDAGTLLRQQVGVKVSSNNGQGFTTSATTNLNNDSTLKHTTQSSNTLVTLANAVKCDGACGAFTANSWGISIDETSTTDNVYNGTYNAVPALNQTPFTVISSSKNGSVDRNVYFAAKADTSRAAGTYEGKVIFTTVSTKPSSDPGTPEGPSQSDPTPQGPSASDPSGGIQTQPSIVEQPQIAYSYTTNNNTYRSTSYYTYATANDTAEEADEGKEVADSSTKKSTKNTYVAPLGANEREYSDVSHISIITIVLMIIACLAAAFGIFFFILAKRRNDDDEEDDPTVL